MSNVLFLDIWVVKGVALDDNHFADSPSCMNVVLWRPSFLNIHECKMRKYLTIVPDSRCVLKHFCLVKV